MGKTLSNVLRPAHPGWEVAVTRISRQVLGRVGSCVRELAGRFSAEGLICVSEVRLLPRGMAAVLSAGTPVGTLFELEYTVVDGMPISGLPGATLDVRLLDSDGYAVAECSPLCDPGVICYHTSADEIIAASADCLSVDAVHEVVADHFDLRQHRRAG
jgi:hypothetical protein